MSKDISRISTPVGQMEQTRTYNGIDLVKFMCSLLVCLLHIPPFQNESFYFARVINYGLQQCVCRIAVPFFFIASGFLLFRNMELDAIDYGKVKNYCFKLLRLYGTWFVLLIVGYKEHLWYLSATVTAVCLLCLCLRLRIKLRYICCLGAVLYLLGLSGDTYRIFTEPVSQLPVLEYVIRAYNNFFFTTRNGLFMGFPFVLIGVLFARSEKKISMNMSILGFVVSMLLLLAEAAWLKLGFNTVSCNMYVFLPAVAFFLFGIAYNLKLKPRPIYLRLRLTSSLIYYAHLIIYVFVGLAVGVVAKYLHVDFSAYLFWIAIPIIVACTALVAELSLKKRFRWLRYLYS